MCKAYLFHTTSIFNFVQMPVADKYTDILYMRTLLFPPIFHGKSITLGRGWRKVYIGFLIVPTPGRRPFMEYPHGSNRKSSIWAPGIMSQIPDFWKQKRAKATYQYFVQ